MVLVMVLAAVEVAVLVVVVKLTTAMKRKRSWTLNTAKKNTKLEVHIPCSESRTEEVKSKHTLI